MPLETRDYVIFVTVRAVEDWKAADADFPIPVIGAAPSFGENCVALALRKSKLDESHLASAPRRPWGAVLAVNFSEALAVKQFQRLKLRFPQELAGRDPLIVRKRNLSRGRRLLNFVMLGEDSQSEASKTCASLNAISAPCIVRKN